MGAAAPAGPTGLRIGQVARRTGVPVATLRAWESRYGFLEPLRTSGGQRLYSDEDVARVRRVRQLLDDGWLVSAAVAQLRADESRTPPATSTGPAPSERHSRPASMALDRAGELEAIDPAAALAAYGALRAILHAGRPADVRDALVELVDDLGGSVGPATTQDSEVIPVDLSFGEGPPLLPRAEQNSLARLRLESLLPGLVEDARGLLERLHAARRVSGPTG